MCSVAHHSATVPFLDHCASGWNRGKWMKLRFRQQWWPNQSLCRCLYCRPGILNTSVCASVLYSNAGLFSAVPPPFLSEVMHWRCQASHMPSNWVASRRRIISHLKSKSARDVTLWFWTEQMVIMDSSLGKHWQRIKLCESILGRLLDAISIG